MISLDVMHPMGGKSDSDAKIFLSCQKSRSIEKEPLACARNKMQLNWTSNRGDMVLHHERPENLRNNLCIPLLCHIILQLSETTHQTDMNSMTG